MKKISAFLFALMVLSANLFAAQIDTAVMILMKSSSSEKISAIVYMKDGIDMSLLPKRRADRVAFLDRFSSASQRNVSDAMAPRKRSGKVKIIKRFWSFNAFLIVADKSVIEELGKRSDILRIELNGTVSLPPEPKPEPGLSTMTRTFTASTTLEPNIEQIKADQVWTGYSINGSGIKVGIADTGCLSTHPALAGKISKEAYFDSSGTQISNTATDVKGHGTHVAGIVAGGLNSDRKSFGVAPGATLLIAKVFSDDSTTSNVAQISGGVQWLYENGAQIINLSIGGTAGVADDTWKTKVDTWNSLGMVVVCAIGNEGPGASTTNSPGNVPNTALGVGAVDSSDTISSISSRGPIVWDSFPYTKPDVCAPGVGINSSYNDGGYIAMTGTSMASPHVTGVAALMLQANPTLEASEVITIIKNNTDRNNANITTIADNDYGWGRVDAFAAVTNSTGPDTSPPIIDHTPVSSSKFGEDMPVSAIVTDNRTTSPATLLYYRNSANVWETLSMSLEAGSGSVYKTTVPASKVNSDIEYYIKATDLASNYSTYPPRAPTTLAKTTVVAQDALAVTEIYSCPSPYSGAGDLSFTFYLSKPAEATIRIFSARGEVIKMISYSGTLGYNSVSWDGVTAFGEKVGNGPYIYHMVLKDSAGALQKTKGKFIVLK